MSGNYFTVMVTEHGRGCQEVESPSLEIETVKSSEDAEGFSGHIKSLLTESLACRSNS